MGKYKKEDLKVVHKKLHFMFFEQKYKYYQSQSLLVAQKYLRVEVPEFYKTESAHTEIITIKRGAQFAGV